MAKRWTSCAVYLAVFSSLISNIFCFQSFPSVLESIARRRAAMAAPATASAAKKNLPDLIRTGATELGSTNIKQDFIYTQVISDVDDTLKSSGGVNVAGVALGGIDVQYERGDFYPGVAEFMLELSRFGLPKSSGLGSDPIVPPKVAILTARAEEFKAALEIKPTSKLAVAMNQAGERAGVPNWGVGPVLYGSVAEWVIQYRKGLRKFTNFERLLQQDPSGLILQYVYVGDTGELDQEAGEAMLREYPEVVKAVFLHVVTDQLGPDDPPVIMPPPKLINGRPLVFFRTYVGAAVDAVQLGFMGVEGLASVIEAATKKLKSVPRSSGKWVDLEQDMLRSAVILESAAG